MNRGVIAAAAMLAVLLLLPLAPLQARQMLAPDAEGYKLMDSAELRGPEYKFVDLSLSEEGGIRLDLNDDSSIEVRLGFEFNFYGETYYVAQISSNGYISFAGSDDSFNKNGLAIPQPVNTSGWQNSPFIAPWFDDLDPEAGGAVYYKIEGDPANHRMTVQWSAAHHDDTVINNERPLIEFQAILYESSNRILFQYRNTVTNDSALSQGASAAAGIQGCTLGTSTCGLAGISYSANEPLLTNELAVGFSPVKYGYVGIPAGSQQQQGGYSQVLSYDVDVINGKDVETDFTVELLPGGRWRVEAPISTGKMAPNERKTLNFKVTVPDAGASAMAEDIVTIRVTDYVEETASGGTPAEGSSTNTQNNEQLTGPPTRNVKEIASIFTLKSSCVVGALPCFEHDSDGDGVADSREAASSVNDPDKLHGFVVLSGKTIDAEVGSSRYETTELADGTEKTTRIFEKCTSPTCSFNGFSADEVVDGPDGMVFPSGLFNYRILTAVSGAATVRITPAAPWPAEFVLYTVDSSGKYVEIDKDEEVKRWVRVANSNSLDLVEVGDGSDLDADGAVNGVIVGRLAIGVKASSVDAGDGFGSGALLGELLLFALLGGGLRYAGWRRGISSVVH